MSDESTGTDIKVCFNLKAERKRLNLKQSDVANFLEMSSKQIGRWESSTPIPSDKLASLSELGFDCMFVLTGQRATLSSVSVSNVDIDYAVEAAAKATGEAIKTVYELRGNESVVNGLDAVKHYGTIVRAAEIIMRAELTGEITSSTVTEIAELIKAK
ncbi:helix-turn-helix transcriptional regulator [Pseudoalteromonas sp. DL2-H2.2]|uniref:helix-turn-helix transcriptional regulator n=1 Tax=Pseudoalteromonas sp. DL2-H2.2 TaxID=2908889 RepID=UPI001F18F4E4|nr:helix-turn-helix transcriptional regulator [Pseudoalteromonas sp. DL2-H2.2]MCF2910777.1 helix-turn-helix transcriptional regulator [Pseudoalteromonas sp. DL2-H2.2]